MSPAVKKLLSLSLALIVAVLIVASCTSRVEPSPVATTAVTTPTQEVPQDTGASNGHAPASVTVPVTTAILPPVADVVEKVRPAVVSIAVEVQGVDFFGRPVRDVARGTGVIFDSRGYLVTNYHVIEGGSKIQVTLADERTFDAQVIGPDPERDLAVLKIGKNDEEFPFATFADPSAIRVGEWAIAVGDALGLPGGPSVTVGVIGALDRTIDLGNNTYYNLLQTDAAINEGNSGGPLLNLKGEVVGINSITLTQAQGIGFAISTITVIPVVQSILEHGRVTWPWLGVELDDITPGKALELNLPLRKGVLIRGVVRNSPADRAGIRSLDIVKSFGGKELITVNQLLTALRLEHKVGEKVQVVLLRDGKETQLDVTLGERPSR